MTSELRADIQVQLHGPDTVEQRLAAGIQLPAGLDAGASCHNLRWLSTLRDGLRHAPYLLEATAQGRTVGVLPLSFVSSRWFDRFLVSLPYLNTGGVRTSDPDAATALIGRAVELADKLDVKHLELRHEVEHVHPALTQSLTNKVHMRLRLPTATEQLWGALKAKVRNQIRKGEQQNFEIAWGGLERLADFYAVFSQNMRDLGTPVFGQSLFTSILERFPQSAEFCVVSLAGRAVAVALLLHGSQVTEVPSASSLRAYNSTNANMFMYWQLLTRAIQRGSGVFDFGRSSVDGNTFRFKQQWGALSEPAVWQYYVRRGTIGDMRPESKKYQFAIRVWKKLPLRVTQWIGPGIVRGIP